MHKCRARGALALITLAIAVAIGGCGEDAPQASGDPLTAFERALNRVGEGVSPTGTGYGWIDLEPRRAAPGTAGALGPGLDELVTRDRRLRAIGIDLSEVEAATSVAASYGYAVRLDGASAGRLARLLRAVGATRRRVGGWTNYDLGEQWQAPLRGRLSGIRDFAARIAVSRDAVILSRTESAREALQDRGRAPLEVPAISLATGCLGEVSSARMLPGTFTHNPFESPDLIALGVQPGVPTREVLCAIGESRERAEKWQRALVASFSPGAEEPLSGEPISRLVSAVEVDGVAQDGLYAARAEIELAEGERPGFLYGALVRGSVLPYVGAPKPIPEGTRLQLKASPARPR